MLKATLSINERKKARRERGWKAGHAFLPPTLGVLESGVLLYGVFSGLVLAPSPPPVPAASLLLGLVSLPGAP